MGLGIQICYTPYNGNILLVDSIDRGSDKLPKIDIVSDRLLSYYALHQILQVSHPLVH